MTDSIRLDLDTIDVKAGAHKSRRDGMCVMEVVAYIAREQHSDSPVCVSPVIGAFMRAWNDGLNDEDRQQLKTLIPVIIDTASTPDDENRRAWMALDWLVREYTPAWLRLAHLDDQADRLAGLPQFWAGMNVPSVRPVIDAVRKDADAAWEAARAAAWDAAGEAARAAARAAAGEAAGAAAWEAARAAAWDAAGEAARAAAWDAAGEAARAAAWDAAGEAARAALRPTVEALQLSAAALVERMAYLKDDE